MSFFARKLWTVAAVAAALGAAAEVSALDMSVGGGGFYAGNFGGGVNGNGVSSAGTITRKLEFKMPYAGYGAYFFIDAQYAEVSIGADAGGGPWDIVETIESGQNVLSQKARTEPLLIGLNFNLLLKYPVAVLSSLVLFPAVGIDYQHCITENVELLGLSTGRTAYSMDVSAEDLRRLWLSFGAGLDFFMSEHFFVRPVLLYGLGMKNTIEKKKISEGVIDPYLRYMLSGANTNVSTSARSSQGLVVKIGAGYKF